MTITTKQLSFLKSGKLDESKAKSLVGRAFYVAKGPSLWRLATATLPTLAESACSNNGRKTFPSDATVVKVNEIGILLILPRMASTDFKHLQTLAVENLSISVHNITHIHIHIYTYTRIHIYTYTVHIHIYTYTHIHIYTYTHIYIYIYIY